MAEATTDDKSITCVVFSNISLKLGENGLPILARPSSNPLKPAVFKFSQTQVNALSEKNVLSVVDESADLGRIADRLIKGSNLPQDKRTPELRVQVISTLTDLIPKPKKPESVLVKSIENKPKKPVKAVEPKTKE